MRKIKYYVSNIVSYPGYIINMTLYKINPIKIDVMSIIDTVEYIISNRASLVRFGDGEFMIMNGEGINNYQESNLKLAQELEQTLYIENNNLLLCLPDVFNGLDKYLYRTRRHWVNEIIRKRNIYNSLAKKDKVYGNAFLTRPYIIFKDRSNVKLIFDSIKHIWKNKEIILIEGRYSRNGVGNDLLDGAKSIKRVLCPPTNAFEKIEEIVESCMEFDKNKLILVSLGPTAKPVIRKLNEFGFQAIDIGHIDSEYEWFLSGVKDRKKIKNKHTAEINDDKDLVHTNDQTYLDQIVKFIE